MSQILLGIIGITIFIISAIAGVSYLGPTFMRSTTDSEAGLALQGLAQLSMAIHLRNAELETVTPAGTDLSTLAPDYLGEAVTNPLGVRAPTLVADDGSLGGPGLLAIMILDGAKAGTLCNSVSRQGGGPDVAPSISPSAATMPLGCFRSDTNVGSHITTGDYIAYATIT